MKLRALLDTSVLIALLDANHIHHRLCSQWLSTHTAGWASCPITLNGCVRILSQAAYPNRLPMHTVVAGLQQAMRHPMHEFWADDINPLDPTAIDWQQVLRPADITDAYLLALAVRQQACLVTLDFCLSLSWATGAQEQHLLRLA
jgi:toxin-antitoxin system PIN domain toxin